MIEAQAGETFDNAVRRVQSHLYNKGSEYTTLNFNDINVTVSYNSNVDDLRTVFYLKQKLAKLM